MRKAKYSYCVRSAVVVVFKNRVNAWRINNFSHPSKIHETVQLLRKVLIIGFIFRT